MLFLPSSVTVALPDALYPEADESIWYPVVPTEEPFLASNTEAVGVNVGTLFTVEVSGELGSICYYRMDGMATSGTVSLWQISNATDVLLAEADFSGHTTTGWQVVPLPESHRLSIAKAYIANVWFPPISGSVYIASTIAYFVDSGHYSEPWQFLYAMVSNGQYDARGFEHRNGLYLYGASGRPTEFNVHNNYWVDVIYTSRPNPDPPQPPMILKWPIPEGWPTFTNTGPDPSTVFDIYLESVSTSADDQVIEDRDMRVGLTIAHNNVTVRNCIITGKVHTISILSGVSGTLIEDCIIEGVGRNNAGSAGININNGTGITIQRCDIRRHENEIALSGTNIIIQDNFLHHLRATPGHPHYDTMQMDGGITDVLISHNTLMNEHNDTAVIMLDNVGGPVDNVTIEDNLMFGAGFTCYVDGRFNPAVTLTNISYIRNQLRPGVYGYFQILEVEPPTMEGNQFIGHGGIFDAPPPGGFVEDQEVPEGLFDYADQASGSITSEALTVEEGGINVGVSFQTAQAGQITGVNFRRPSFSSTAIVTVGLWRFTGSNLAGAIELLATRTFTTVTTTGLRNFEFTTPVDVDAGDNLLVGVFIPRGSDGKVWMFYEAGIHTSNLSSQWDRFTAFNNSSTALNGFTGGNGLFTYGPAAVPPLTPSGSSRSYDVSPIFSAPWVEP